MKSPLGDKGFKKTLTVMSLEQVLFEIEKKVDPLKPDGLAHSAMTDAQKKLLMELIEEYIATHRPSLAKADMQRINLAGIGKVAFAWTGSMEIGKPHYYRVQGPTFLLEYDNIQNGANHPHTVWRDFDGDLLREHHAEAHKPGN